jgi:ribonucleotide reductase, class II
MSLAELKTYTFTSRYARWNKKKKRRETWGEACDRVESMMLEKYADFPSVHEDIKWAYSQMRKKRVLGSQRALQFGGKPILKTNMRIFNCISSYCDRPRFFQECMYLLLCGCGTGFSVQTHHIAKMPDLVDEIKYTKKFVIEDTIEGWSDAIGVLIGAYLKCDLFPEYNGRNVEFDFSQIRPAGSELSSSGGKAPGPKPLKKALKQIEEILRSAQNNQERLTSTQCYDIVMHAADSVISGGVRRSATICMFSPDDEEMMSAKTGDWFYENPQRGRSNNSVVLLRDQCSEQQFLDIVTKIKEFGEPGFVLVDDLESLFNPCVVGNTVITTDSGLALATDLINKPFTALVDGKGFESKKGFWRTGHQDVIKLELESGRSLRVTGNHKIMTTDGWKEAEDLSLNDEIVINNHRNFELGKSSTLTVKESAQGYLLGSLLGDGNISNNVAQLKWWGADKKEYRDQAVSILRDAGFDSSYTKDEQDTKSVYSSLGSVKLLDFAISKECYYPSCEGDKPMGKALRKKTIVGSWDYLAGLVAGYFDADGTVIFNPKKGSSLRICSSQLENLENIQIVLNAFGIYSKIYKDRRVAGYYKLPDGSGGLAEFWCEATHDLVISCDNIQRFERFIPIKNKSKISKLNDIVESYRRTPNRTSFTDKLINKSNDGAESVYDCTVENIHAFDANGAYVHNCVEINLYGYNEKGESGWEACNLSTINCKAVKTEEEFYQSCRAAAIIGTLQAGFTDPGYLTEVSQEIMEREALIGVSMTGIMENPDICLDPRIQKQGAKLIKKTNRMIAELIGINPAARTTCIKPEGTASCVLGTSSGIHPHHARRYIRRVQANKLDEVYKHFNRTNPKACTESVWSANDSDDVISFCIEVPDGAKIKNQMSAIDLLKSVRSTQKNWVTNGKDESLCVKPWLNHNVSNTINVKPEEWDEVAKFIYKNREHFCGISLLPISGDKDFAQAPFTSVYLPTQMLKQYGDGIVFCSGLIEEGKKLWDDNLWVASDAIMGVVKSRGQEKKKWLAKCEKFAANYFDGDLKKLTYAMKDIDNYKLWTELQSNYQNVNYENMFEDKDNTKLEETVACSGGACELV